MTGRRSSLLLVLISCATGSLAKAPCSKLSNEAVVGSAMVNAGGELSFESGMQAGERGLSRGATCKSTCWLEPSDRPPRCLLEQSAFSDVSCSLCEHACPIRWLLTVLAGFQTNWPGTQIPRTACHNAGAVAYGVYLDSAQTISNFGKLRIVTSADHSDVEQMTAAGWLEGYLTAARINDHHHNLRHYFVKQLNASLDKPMQW